MPRWVWFVPVGGLLMAVAIIGYRLGWERASLSESDVIGAFADQHKAEGFAGDCVGLPGQKPGVWIVVRCGDGNSRRDYSADRSGRLVETQETGGKPET